jgi:hypothetical protein
VGGPDSSLKKTGPGATGTANSGMIRRPCVCGRTGTKSRRSKVSPSEGNEVRREGCQEVAASHSSGEAGERPFRTPSSEGDAALWTESWNHAEDVVPHQRVTAKRPSRVRDSDIPQRDEPDALMCTSGSVGAPWGDPARNPACDHFWRDPSVTAPWHRAAGRAALRSLLRVLQSFDRFENSLRRILDAGPQSQNAPEPDSVDKQCRVEEQPV